MLTLQQSCVQLRHPRAKRDLRKVLAPRLVPLCTVGPRGLQNAHVLLPWSDSRGLDNAHACCPALQRQNAENVKQIFPEKEYRGLSPNFHIHVSVSELYIPTMGLPVLLEEICRLILGIYKSLKDT
jgi:hypothetical protein